MSEPKQKSWVLDLHTGRIKYRALDSYERRGGIYMTCKQQHNSFEEAKAALLRDRQQKVDRESKELLAAIRRLNAAIALEQEPKAA